ncbi:MAG: hypothetical protein LBV60_21730 [Streptomyces sp.]|nr:hypothetical protein [Streptomyces sp.]
MTESTAAADPLKRLSEEGVATFEVVSQGLPKAVTASLRNKEVEGD